MSDLSASNLKLLIRHAIAISLSIAVPCSWVITDLLLLNLKFDLTRFGAIKSSMFLVPAISYWLLANKLRDLSIAPAVCRWAYLIRIVVPLSLPLAVPKMLHASALQTRLLHGPSTLMQKQSRLANRSDISQGWFILQPAQSSIVMIN